MQNTIIIFKKQVKDTLKNKAILIQFVMFPLLALLMEKTVHIDSIQKIARFTYSEQIHLLLDTGDAPDLFGTVVLAANITVFILLFVLLYRKKGLE